MDKEKKAIAYEVTYDDILAENKKKIKKSKITAIIISAIIVTIAILFIVGLNTNIISIGG